jgi:hypothetical protein
LQVKGQAAFRGPEVETALQLTPGQRQRVREIDAEVTKNAFPPPGTPRFTWRPYDVRLREGAERCVALLTTPQKAKWRELSGKPYTGPHPFFSPRPHFGPR